MVKLMNIF